MERDTEGSQENSIQDSLDPRSHLHASQPVWTGQPIMTLGESPFLQPPLKD